MITVEEHPAISGGIVSKNTRNIRKLTKPLFERMNCGKRAKK